MSNYKSRFYPLSIFLVLFLFQCDLVEWEPITKDNKPQLNVIGILSQNEDLSSFVYISKTLNPGAKEKKLKGSTTIIDTSYNWKHIPEKDTMVVDSSDYRIDTNKVKIHESKFLVKDAEVFISGGKEIYELKPIRIRNRFYPGQENTSFSKSFIFPEEETVIYTDTTNRFQPQPNTEYYLTVKTDSLGKLTGTVKTPSEIYFTNKSGIEDTLIYNNSYTLKWNNVRTGNLQLKIGTRWHAREIEINRKDSSYKFLVESSRHQFLTIRNMEENYYKYFHSEDSEEISNIMIGRTVVAKSCGVKGGYGFLEHLILIR